MQKLREAISSFVHSASLIKAKSLIPIWIALSFYSTGRFGFLNAIGLRRELQIALLSFVVIIPFTQKIRIHEISRSHLFWIIGLLTLTYPLYPSFLLVGLVNFLFTLAVIVFLHSASRIEIRRICKYFANIACFFSLLGCIQFVIYAFHPDLFYNLDRPYESSTGSKDITLSHPVQWLGFVVPDTYELFGFEMVRFFSFASEPSNTIPSILFPGLIGALLYPNQKLRIFIIFFFGVILAHSGSILLGLGIGMILFSYLTIVKTLGFFSKNPAIHSLILLFVYLIGLYALSQLEVAKVVDELTTRSEALSNVSDIGTRKHHSATVRFSGFKDSAMQIIREPLGSGFGYEILGSNGMLLKLGLYNGFISMAIFVAFLYYLVKDAIRYFFEQSNLFQRGILCMLTGLVFMIAFFTSHGWFTPIGIGCLILAKKILQPDFQTKRVASMNQSTIPGSSV